MRKTLKDIIGLHRDCKDKARVYRVELTQVNKGMFQLITFDLSGS